MCWCCSRWRWQIELFFPLEKKTKKSQMTKALVMCLVVYKQLWKMNMVSLLHKQYINGNPLILELKSAATLLTRYNTILKLWGLSKEFLCILVAKKAAKLLEFKVWSPKLGVWMATFYIFLKSLNLTSYSFVAPWAT